MNFLGHIKGNKDFKDVYSRGKSTADRFLVLYCLPNGLPYSRIGLSVGKKVGKAVIRNRFKRQIKEIARINSYKIKKGLDCVIIVRPRSLEADYNALENSFLKLLKKSEAGKKRDEQKR